MTLGEKLKVARQQFGWSQEELADKLYVSRAAVAKWETDNGIPDMSNLKVISDLLQVSVDYLLDYNATPIKFVIKEPINIKNFGKGIKKRKIDRAIKSRYPDAEIHTIIPKQKLTKSEKVVDNILGFAPLGAFGIPDMLNAFKLAGEYYLVIKGELQYLVLVADDYIESQELALFSFDTLSLFSFDTLFNNSSAETPYNFANSSKFAVLGSDVPVSHFDTACLLTPIDSATNSCVILHFIRYPFNVSPNDFRTFCFSALISDDFRYLLRAFINKNIR